MTCGKPRRPVTQMVGDPAGSREDIFVRCSIINSTSARPDFPAQATAAIGPLPPFSISPRYQSTKRSIPCASDIRSEEHTSELQSLMRISYAVFCLKKKKKHTE